MSKAPGPKGQKIIKDFDGNNSPDDFTIPSVGIEDIDRAIFELFDKKISFEVSNEGKLQKVPVIFASGERFALTRRKNPIRDRANALILPIISIMRNDIDFTPSQSGKGTAISFREQQSYRVRYRLSERDRKFQNIVNKMGIKNQSNVASLNNLLENTGLTGGRGAVPGTVATRRTNESMSFSKDAKLALESDLGVNIFEIIEVPYPEFIAINYDIIFWTQYMKQANQMIETLLVNFTGQGEEIPITTNGGYELVAFFKGTFSNSSNLDEFTDSERIIKHTFSVTIPGYIINPRHPGLPNLVRTYTSAPVISFTFADANAAVISYQSETNEEKVARHVLTDLTAVDENSLRRGESSAVIENFVRNPFSSSTKTEFSRIKSRNVRTGETVASSKIIGALEDQQE
jgi:hypothetical protein